MVLTLVALAAFVLLAFLRVSAISWLLAFMVFVPVLALQLRISDGALQGIYVAMFLLGVLFAIPPVRRRVVTPLILPLFRRFLPQTSAAEQSAIEAGSVGWEGELFSGYPDWDKLLAQPRCGLKSGERAFLDNEVERLCAMLNDWEITHRQADFSPDVWDFLKGNGFFGLSIPWRYGGREFSAQARSAILGKIASRSSTAAATVMAPNSLGPADLLLRYGTNEQKEHYLPRLAAGQEIPCFALTGPFPGSDAGAMPDYGVVCRANFGGQENVLGIRLNWDKRYITLAPVATLLGLAFKLHDPQRLLGGEVDRGITIALIPADTPGVTLGRRHFPLNSAFLNGPTRGRDVFIPLEFLIGGVAQVGQGWPMLLECLAAGRGISLPACSVGTMQLAARSTGAYARIRRQFGLPIGKFEGVEEPLARIAANTYMIDAGRRMTALAVDLGEKPLAVSAIMKYHATERARQVVNDAMDIVGSKGVCLGPENLLGRIYQQMPIAATLEGANSLMRNRVIFGQGLMRAHPYLLKEMAAAKEANPQEARMKFDQAFFGHVGFFFNNAARSLVFGIFGALIPVQHGVGAPHYFRKLTRYAAAFALCADVVTALPGRSLKRREKLFARLGDVLSLLYLGSATLKRFEDDGCLPEDRPLLDWAMQDTLWRIQEALSGTLRNLPFWPLRALLHMLVFPLGSRITPPSDVLDQRVAAMLMRRGGSRDRLAGGMYLPEGENEPLGALESALASTVGSEILRKKLDAAYRAGELHAHDELARISEARARGLIDPAQALRLERDYALRCKVMMVDEFETDDLRAGPKKRASRKAAD
jgi:acyl-CoA dehydrogenase